MYAERMLRIHNSLFPLDSIFSQEQYHYAAHEDGTLNFQRNLRLNFVYHNGEYFCVVFLYICTFVLINKTVLL